MAAKPPHHHSLNALRQPLLLSGLVFYFAHILQQAQASNTSLASDPKISDLDNISLLDLEHDQKTIDQANASNDDMPLQSLSLSSQEVPPVSLVSDDKDQVSLSSEESTGKDAIDIPESGGVSPLLLLGGVALIGGGIALLSDDSGDNNSSQIETPALTVRPLTAYEGQGVANIEFELSHAAKRDIEIEFYVITSDSALEGYDVEQADDGVHTATIKAGATEAIYELGLIDNDFAEEVESLNLLVTESEHFLNDQGLMELFIIDDDLRYDAGDVYISSNFVDYEVGSSTEVYGLTSTSLSEIVLKEDDTSTNTEWVTGLSAAAGFVTTETNDDGYLDFAIVQNTNGVSSLALYESSVSEETDAVSYALTDSIGITSVNADLVSAMGVEWGDINGDSLNDCIVGDAAGQTVALLGSDDGSLPSTWTSVSTASSGDRSVTRSNFVVNDLNGDGSDELVSTYSDGSVFMTSYQEAAEDSSAMLSDSELVAADETAELTNPALTNDIDDQVVYTSGTNQLSSLTVVDGEVSSEVLVTLNENDVIVAPSTSADLDGDNRPELLTPLSNGLAITLENGETIGAEDYLASTVGTLTGPATAIDEVGGTSILMQTSSGLELFTSSESSLPQMTLAIDDSLTMPILTVADVEVGEADGVATLTFLLDAPAEQPVAVNYITSNGNANAINDYESAADQVIFEAGKSSKTVEIDVLYFATSEEQESFTVNLYSPQGLEIANDSVSVSVIDFKVFFLETFSDELAYWEVIPSTTAQSTDLIGGFATFEYVDSEWAGGGYWGSINNVEVPSFYSSGNGYALYNSGYYGDGTASQYSTMQTLESISVDENVQTTLEFEVYYAWFTYDNHDASIYVVIKDADVELVDLSGTDHSDALAAITDTINSDSITDAVLFDASGDGISDTALYKLFPEVEANQWDDSDNPIRFTVDLPLEITNSGSIDLAYVWQGAQPFGIGIDDIIIYESGDYNFEQPAYATEAILRNNSDSDMVHVLRGDVVRDSVDRSTGGFEDENQVVELEGDVNELDLFG